LTPHSDLSELPIGNWSVDLDHDVVSANLHSARIVGESASGGASGNGAGVLRVALGVAESALRSESILIANPQD